MMTVDEIFANDRRRHPEDRSLPWEEMQDGVTVVVEPRPHWSADMRAFRRDTREYCTYADWTENGQRARFYGHIDTSGETVMAKAREIIAREIVGFWTA